MRTLPKPIERKFTTVQAYRHPPICLWLCRDTLGFLLFWLAFISSNKNSKYKKVSQLSQKNVPGINYPYAASFSLTKLRRALTWIHRSFQFWPQGWHPLYIDYIYLVGPRTSTPVCWILSSSSSLLSLAPALFGCALSFHPRTPPKGATVSHNLLFFLVLHIWSVTKSHLFYLPSLRFTPFFLPSFLRIVVILHLNNLDSMLMNQSQPPNYPFDL